MSSIRRIKKVLSSKPTLEGAGVYLKRVFGNEHVPEFDPFLLLDDFHSSDPADYLAGFPWHPHRGIETITYVLHGRVEHEDSIGNKGEITAGDMQWMTAGSGIVHQEMPKSNRDTLRRGVGRHDVGHRRLDPQPRQPRHQIHRAALRRRSAGSTPLRCRRAAATTRPPMPGSISRCAPRTPPRSSSRSATSPPPGRHRALRRSALEGAIRRAFPGSALKNIHWYPAIPPGLEEIEGRVLDRIKAAN